MTEPLGADLRLLVDRQAIWDCLMRYARGVDRLDEELIRSAFWADAHDDHGAIQGTPDDFIAAWVPTQAAREACQHSITNHTVAVDGAVAHAESYFQVSIRDYGSDVLELTGGRYLDRFEHRGGQWRIADRLVVLDWSCGADASGMDSRLAGRSRGSRDRTDASYTRSIR